MAVLRRVQDGEGDLPPAGVSVPAALVPDAGDHVALANELRPCDQGEWPLSLERQCGPREIPSLHRAVDVPSIESHGLTERTAFVMRHFEDLSIREISSSLKLKDNATKNTIFRAVKKLRQVLAPALGDTL